MRHRRSGIASGDPKRAILWQAVGLCVALSCCKTSGRAPTEEPEKRESDKVAAPNPASANASTSVVSWQEPIEIATGKAYQGPWKMNESEFFYVDDPSADFGGEGSLGLVWVDNQQRDILFQSYASEGRAASGERVNVSKSPQVFSWGPRILVEEGGKSVFILWQEIVFSGGTHGGEIFFSRSVDGGRHFDEALNLSNTKAGAGKGRLTKERWDNGSLDLARGPTGILFAVWTEYEGALRFSRSTNAGQSFSAPLRIAGTAVEPARAPTLAVGEKGAVYVAWTVGEDPKADIHVAASDNDGQSFGPGRPVFSSSGYADAPSLAVDGRGRLHLVYHESSTGPFGRSHVRYTRMDPGQAFTRPRRISGAKRGPTSAAYASLAIDAKDRLAVVWEHYPNFKSRPSGLGFSASRDTGQTFSPPAVVPGTDRPDLGFNGGLQGLLMNKLAMADDGTLAIVNSRFKPGKRSVIRLIRGSWR